jgi:chromosome partitioning protein
MHILGIYLPKGGVGKTATAVNLACEAATRGARVLLVDLDPQAAASWYLGLQVADGAGIASALAGEVDAPPIVASAHARLDVLPMDLEARHLEAELAARKHPKRRLGRLLDAVADRYDLVVIDCAPSAALLADAVLKTATALLVPLVPTWLSLMAYERLALLVAEAAPDMPLLPFFSMVDRRRKLHCEVVSRFASTHAEVLPVYVPYAAQVERMGEHRAPLASFAAASPAHRAHVELYRCVAARLGLPYLESLSASP